jgi:hypothetical protein
MRACVQFLRQLAVRPLLLYPLLFVAGVVASALPTMRTGVVLPQEYDEFAYLLGADTLMHGRLANPPHPLAPFFETMHVLQQPTYASKYPPGQSLQLAAGMLLGHPIFGVWLTIGLFAVATAWMLRGLAPATWAALGGLVFSWQWGALTYWGRSYWGGSLFALAGMLVFGGAIRFWKKPSLSAAWWAGVGAGIMVLTRPYEGLWFCAVPAAAMAWRWKMEDGKRKKKIFMSLAALAPITAGLAFLLIYNRTVTGAALKFPHSLYQEQQMPDVGVFVWDHPGPAPAGRNPEISYQLHRFNPEVIFAPSINLADLIRAHATVVIPRFAGFFSGSLFGLGLAWAIVSGLAWRRPTGRLAISCVAGLFLMLLTLRFFGFPHYAAAWTAPLAALIILGFRGLGAFRWPGRSLTPTLIALLLAGWAVVTLAQQTARGDPPQLWAISRLEVTNQLEDQAAQEHRGQVVFVMMAEGQPAFAEWVYNGADIDAQTVIFARSLGPNRDIAVAKYYPTRHLWQAWLKPDGELDRLTTYDPAKKSAPPATKG